jgi:hypothetical protein
MGENFFAHTAGESSMSQLAGGQNNDKALQDAENLHG